MILHGALRMESGEWSIEHHTDSLRFVVQGANDCETINYCEADISIAKHKRIGS